MQTAQLGDRVQVRYRISTGDAAAGGSRGRAPVEVTVGTAHPRLPGLGNALVGMAPGTRATVRVPAERGFAPPDPARVRRWPRTRFPKGATLQVGKLLRLTDGQGRRRVVRVLEVSGKVVVVDTNHPLAGRALELEVELLAIHAPDAAPGSEVNRREDGSAGRGGQG